MNHNLETVKLKLRAYNTHRGRLEDVFKELESLEKELKETIEWCEKDIAEEAEQNPFSYQQLGSTVLKEYILQILGKKELIRNV